MTPEEIVARATHEGLVLGWRMENGAIKLTVARPAHMTALPVWLVEEKATWDPEEMRQAIMNEAEWRAELLDPAAVVRRCRQEGIILTREQNEYGPTVGYRMPVGLDLPTWLRDWLQFNSDPGPLLAALDAANAKEDQIPFPTRTPLSRAEREAMAGVTEDWAIWERALDAVIEADGAGVRFAVEDGQGAISGEGTPSTLNAISTESPGELRLAVALVAIAHQKGVSVSSLANLPTRYTFLKDHGDAAQKLAVDGGTQ